MNKEIPSLIELTEASIDHVIDLASDLSIPEILIAGSRPFHGRARNNSEILQLNKVVRKKSRALATKQHQIYQEIAAALGITSYSGIFPRAVESWLEKYEILTGPQVVPPSLESRLDKDLLRTIMKYRVAIEAYQSEANKPVNDVTFNFLSNLESTPVNLRILYHPQYHKEKVHLVVTRTKTPYRLAGKIPYAMIDKCRRRSGKKYSFGQLKKNVDLDDGNVRDSAGIQFVFLDGNTLWDAKELISLSPNIAILDIDNYYQKPDGLYRAVHLDAVWSPQSTRAQRPYSTHVDYVEVMLMEFPHFMYANFGGTDAYWNRLHLQQQGIVSKNKRYGKLDISPFTDTERKWKERTEKRIVKILTYKG